MKHIAVGAFVALALYLILNMLFGPGGTQATQELADHHVQVRENIEQLKRLNRSLEAEVLRLRQDPDEIRLRARDLGYYATSEKVIRVEGWNRSPSTRSPGKEVRPYADDSDNRAQVRSAALSAGLLALILSLLVERFQSNRQSRTQTASRT